MTTEIAVRLPDEMVSFLDRTVAAGKAPSRAALVAAALEREMRRRAAEHDAEVLHQHGAANDLDDLVQWSSTHIEVGDGSVREMCLVCFDKTRPALAGREAARAAMTMVTVAPITTTSRAGAAGSG